MINQVSKSDRITIKLGITASPLLVRNEKPDSVIIAIGANHSIPNIPGAGGKNVIFAQQVFGKEDLLGEKVIIIGGGAVGCETAVHLQTLGKKVDIVEMESKMIPEGKDLPVESFLTRFFLDHELDMERRDLVDVKEIDLVTQHLKSKCVEITEHGAWIESEGQRRFIEADTVIMATGFKMDVNKLEEFEACAFDVIRIGDCEKVGSILSASSSGFYAALRI